MNLFPRRNPRKRTGRINVFYALTSVSLALVSPAFAQNFNYLALDPNSNVYIDKDGAVVTPSSSIPSASPVAHTNVHIVQRNGMPAITGVSPLGGPPVPALHFETPTTIACLYNINQTFGNKSVCDPNGTLRWVPNGGGRAIAIVDAYHAPNALADLNAFSTQFGLPLATAANFEVHFAAPHLVGSPIGPPIGAEMTIPPAYVAGWETEISLDVQWAHAMAPNAKIILVEAYSNSNDDMLMAEAMAGRLVGFAGGGQVSNSWSTSEFPEEAHYDFYFANGMTPLIKTNNVSYFAATGDSPGTEYPSVSVNVIAVGGTTVRRDPTTGVFLGESSWINAGGGASAYIGRPLYQNSVSSKMSGTVQRGVPDVAAVSDPGVWIYVRNQGGWIVVRGTSVATPIVAGIANNAGTFSFSSEAQLTSIYGNDQQNFTDITMGNCGPAAAWATTTGWDFCTGLGTPNGVVALQ